MIFRFKRKREEEEETPEEPWRDGSVPYYTKVLRLEDGDGDPLPSGEPPTRLISVYRPDDWISYIDFRVTLRGKDLGNGLTVLDIYIWHSQEHEPGGCDNGWTDYYRWTGTVFGAKNASEAERQAVKEYNYLRGNEIIKTCDHYSTLEIEGLLKEMYFGTIYSGWGYIESFIEDAVVGLGLRYEEGTE